MEYTILQALQTIINGLQLQSWTGTIVPSVIRKLPTVDETIDVLPQLYLVPSSREPQRVPYTFGPVSSGPFYKVIYPCELVFIAGGNHDFTSNLNVYTGWLTSIANAFKSPAVLRSMVPQVWDENVRPNVVIDRQFVNDNYDYGGLTIDVITVE